MGCGLGLGLDNSGLGLGLGLGLFSLDSDSDSDLLTSAGLGLGLGLESCGLGLGLGLGHCWTRYKSANHGAPLTDRKDIDFSLPHHTPAFDVPLRGVPVGILPRLVRKN